MGSFFQFLPMQLYYYIIIFYFHLYNVHLITRYYAILCYYVKTKIIIIIM